SDVLDLPGSVFLDQQAEEVPHERVALSENGVDRGRLRTSVELGIAQDLLQLRHLLRHLDEVGELLTDRGDAPGFLRGRKERPRIGAVNDTHETRSRSSTEKSRSPIASSISLRWSSRSS